MASTSTSPPPLELFYSYAHTDEDLRGKLEKHLAALQRAQLISGWSDRKILPGTEWAAEIQAAMERAGIILLLISADFLASEYCFNIELPFALKRHQTGSAIVIPVLLRPVEWRDTPFAVLQALPDGARAVTLWPNQDEAFADIAARLRERIYAQRLAAAKPVSVPASQPSTVAQQRVLDAAVASHIALGEPADVVTMLHMVESQGLKAILRLDTSYNIPPENVQSKSFEVEFPRDAAGQVLPAALDLILDSPGCDPPQQRRKIRVPPNGDSDVCVFLLTPLKAGRLMLNLEVRYDDVEVGSRLLVTEAGPQVATASPYSLVSMPLTSTAGWNFSLPGIQKAYAPLPEPPAPPTASMAPGRRRVEQMPNISPASDYTGKVSHQQAAAPQSVPQVAVPPAAPGPRKKPWLTRPIMAAAASSAALLVVGGVLLTTGPKSDAPSSYSSKGGASQRLDPVTALRPPPVAAAPRAQPALDAALTASKAGDYQVVITKLTEAINHDPSNAELYWRRAEAYQRLKDPSLALQDLDRSIQLAPDAFYPHLLKAEILSGSGLHQQAVQEYQHAASAPSASPQAKQFAAKRAEQSAAKPTQ